MYFRKVTFSRVTENTLLSPNGPTMQFKKNKMDTNSANCCPAICGCLACSHTAGSQTNNSRYSGLLKKPESCCTATATYESTFFRAVLA